MSAPINNQQSSGQNKLLVKNQVMSCFQDPFEFNSVKNEIIQRLAAAQSAKLKDPFLMVYGMAQSDFRLPFLFVVMGPADCI